MILSVTFVVEIQIRNVVLAPVIYVVENRNLTCSFYVMNVTWPIIFTAWIHLWIRSLKRSTGMIIKVFCYCYYVKNWMWKEDFWRYRMCIKVLKNFIANVYLPLITLFGYYKGLGTSFYLHFLILAVLLLIWCLCSFKNTNQIALTPLCPPRGPSTILFNWFLQVYFLFFSFIFPNTLYPSQIKYLSAP